MNINAVTAEREIASVIQQYLEAVRTWNEGLFRSTFHPKANIQHYFVKGDEIRTSTLDEFVDSIKSLHGIANNPGDP